LLGFHRPLLDRTVNLAQVIDTGLALGSCPGADSVGKRYYRQNTDDGDNYHDFDEGKTPLG
jgi:hypothetical protein